MSIVTLDKKTILVTGAAGFIGSNLVKRIYQEDPSATVIGIDNMNAYYDVALKEFRLNELAKYGWFWAGTEHTASKIYRVCICIDCSFHRLRVARRCQNFSLI